MTAKDKLVTDVGDLVAKALAPIPYWVGYKHAKFWRSKLTEAAIVTELRETLLARCDGNLTVSCEVAYSDLGLVDSARKRGRPIQADLVLAKKGRSKGKAGRVLAVIEVKRGARLSTKALDDVSRLRQLRTGTHKRVRTFLVLVSESGRPKHGLTDRGTADRKFANKGFARVKVRRVLRALGHAAKAEGSNWKDASKCQQQHWAVLYEID